MNYKQKYKEALDNAKVVYKTIRKDLKPVVEQIFPELKMSEDEKIRKQIISFLKEFEYDHYRCLDFSSWIDWLEKQGEQRPTIFIPKFCVGDKLVSTKNPRLTYEVLEVGHINELGNPEYKVEIFTDGKGSNPRNIHDMECHKVDEWAKLIEQKPTDKAEPKFKVGDWVFIEWANKKDLFQIKNVDCFGYSFDEYFTIPFMYEDVLSKWTINDAKEGDVLAWDNSKCIALFKNIYDEDLFNSRGFVGHCSGIFEPKEAQHNIIGAHPATKEQRDLLFIKMKDAGYEWDAMKKQLKKL